MLVFSVSNDIYGNFEDEFDNGHRTLFQAWKNNNDDDNTGDDGNTSHRKMCRLSDH